MFTGKPLSWHYAQVKSYFKTWNGTDRDDILHFILMIWDNTLMERICSHGKNLHLMREQILS